MPYKIRKVGNGFKVGHKGTTKTYSKKPMSKEKATAQMRAIYANTNESFDTRLAAAMALVETPDS